jgi:hypothetical protein
MGCKDSKMAQNRKFWKSEKQIKIRENLAKLYRYGTAYTAPQNKNNGSGSGI